LRIVTLALAFLALSTLAVAQSPNTEHTLQLDPGKKGQRASLEDVAWMVGSWEGEAFGGMVEEVWSTASAGTMMGMFKLVSGDAPSFYEFQLVVETEGTLELQLKHFHADFKGWEEKDDFISFPLVKLTESGAYFSGLTYLRQGPDKIQVFVALKQDGKTQEAGLLFHRVGSPANRVKGIE